MFGRGVLFHLYYLPLCLAILQSGFVNAENRDDVQFDLKPKSCVAISKGKDCYGDLVVTWQLHSPRNVCLYLEQRERPIYCWTKRLVGDYAGPFVLSESSKYLLVDIESKEVLFTGAIDVKWVFKESRKRRRWRLF